MLVGGRIRQLRWDDILFDMMHKCIGINKAGSRLVSKGNVLRMPHQKHLITRKSLEEEVMKYQKSMITQTLPNILPSSYGMLAERCSDDCNEWVKIGILQLFGKLVFMTTTTWLFGTSSFSTTENFDSLLNFEKNFFTLFRSPSLLIPFNREGYNAREKLLSDLKASLCESPPMDENESNRIGELMSNIINIAMNNVELSSPEECARLALVVLFAATANAIPTIFWVIYHILADKDAYQAIQEEAFNILDKKIKSHDRTTLPVSPEKRFSLADLDEMVRLESLITEVLSFRSTQKAVRRRVATEDFELKVPINGEMRQFNVKKGTLVLTCPAMVHFDEEVFENAYTFNWKRFLPCKDGEAQIFKKNGIQISNPVQAFGGGTTLCPGRKFAMAEIKLIVATFLIDHDIRFAGQVTSKPREEVNGDGNFGMPNCDVFIEICKRNDFP